ncbi:unnamed protein product [Trichobilharzia szidati]|nr:unnamed protein product [Trichobilharzia szidati]
MIAILEANESFGAQWTAYAAITCLVWTVILCVFLFLVFKNNLRISLILIGIIIALWSGAICFTYCRGPDFKCYFLLGFVILEDLLTIIACIYVKRFKPVVIIVLISVSIAFLITGAVLFFLEMRQMKYSELAGGLWNTAVAILVLVFASSLK